MQSGLGFLEVKIWPERQVRFRVGGTLKGGASETEEAWLHIAEDDLGGLWFWFQKTL